MAPRRSRTIASFEDFLSAKFGSGAVNRIAGGRFESVLYARPMGMVLGAISGLAVSLAAIIATQIDTLRVTCLALAALACVRLLGVTLATRVGGAAKSVYLSVYPFCALLYAALAGLSAGIAIARGANPQLQLILVAYAMTYGAGMTLGNTGRPVVALGQMTLALMPISLAALFDGGALMLVLGAMVPVLATGITVIAMRMFGALSDQLRAAQESAELAEQMKVQARTDPVTGLANRAGFEQAARLAIESGEDTPFVLLWLDLHRFTEVNDTLGHQMGDLVLREVAERLRRRCPEDAIIARFGSDEFMIGTRHSTRRARQDIAGAISADMAMPMRLLGHRITSGVSIGVAELREGENLDTLMQHADIALYHAKIGGRHRICHFDGAMTRNLVRRKEIEAELRAAILKDELSIYFQPIIDLRTGRIRSFEALVRWFHPEKGELVPEEFIPVAEETGLIITLGNWITRQAARACATWPEEVTLAVNLSPVQIRAPGAALGILNALDEAGLDPSRLELEVTENLFLEDHQGTARFMEELSGEGVRFALDDFGTGYSSLHYINKYPFRTIKVDRSFVSGPSTGRKSDAIIRAVAEMGSTLGLDIVAEGLETAEQVQSVRHAGCTLGQGYFFSRAVPDHLAARLLAEERGPAEERLAS